MKKKLISAALSLSMMLGMTTASISAHAASLPTSATLVDVWKAPATTMRMNALGEQTIDGKSGYAYTPTGDADVMWLQFEYVNLDVVNYPYMIVDYYYEVPQEVDYDYCADYMTFNIHQLNQSGWSKPDSVVSAGSAQSTALEQNTWSQAVLDLRDLKAAIEKDATGQAVMQYGLHIFGDITGNNLKQQKMYINGIHLSNMKPYEYPPEVHYDADQKAYAYVCEEGYVTIDGEKLGAYQTVQEAFEALNGADATIYISGAVKFTDIASRGKVTLRGLGDTEADIAKNKLSDFCKVLGGDITVDYLTLVGTGGGSESGLSSTGAEITIGKNIAQKANLWIGLYGVSDEKSTAPRKMIINGGKWNAVSAGTNATFKTGMTSGSVEYIFNDGEFFAIYGGSKAWWEWSNNAINGDVRYTFNGGTFSGEVRLGSDYSPNAVNGNVIFTVNGGVWENKNIIAGHQYEFNASGNKNKTYLKNTAVLVDIKEAQKEGNSISTLTLGSSGAGNMISEKEIYVLNHYEQNKGTKIHSESTAPYRIHVYNGSAEPIFAETEEGYGGALTGFRLTADQDGAIPYLNGTALVAENGIYSIPENTTAGEFTEIVFAKNTDDVYGIDLSETGITAKVYALSNATKMTLAVAEYDGSTLSEVHWVEKTVTGFDTISTNMTKTEGKTYRIYLWDANMNPYQNAKIF